MFARTSFRLRLAAPAAILVLLGTLAVHAGKEYQAPRANRASTYPARDSHPNEHVTIAADPYDTPDKLKIFRMKYLERGILPIYLIVTNDGSSPLVLRNMDVQLTSSERRARLSPLEAEDLFRRLQRVRRSTQVPIGPIPRTGGPKVKGGLKQEDRDEIDRALFRAMAVDPNSTQSGFLFFDVSELDYPLPNATLYITGLADAGGKDLMYFEIPLDRVLAQ